jgi:hypothetical protein
MTCACGRSRVQTTRTGKAMWLICASPTDRYVLQYGAGSALCAACQTACGYDPRGAPWVDGFGGDGQYKVVPPSNPGPDFEEDLDAEMGFRAAPARRRHRHPRGMVRAAARTHTDRDRAELRYNDYPWWSKRDRDHGLLLQKGKRP